jgi:hypothetical protein
MRFPTRLLALALFVAVPAYAQSAAAPSLAPTDFVAPTASIVTPDAPRAASDNAISLIAIPVAASTVVTSDMTASNGAALTGLRAGVHTRETARAGITAPNNANLGQARALMIVGVAGLIAGAIVGGTPGTLIMVGGALVGLYGLYDFLQ